MRVLLSFFAALVFCIAVACTTEGKDAAPSFRITGETSITHTSSRHPVPLSYIYEEYQTNTENAYAHARFRYAGENADKELYDNNIDGTIDRVVQQGGANGPVEVTNANENERRVYRAITRARDDHPSYTNTRPVLLGYERIFQDEYFNRIKGKRVGIIAHKATRATVDHFLEQGVTVETIFSPEHGFSLEGEAGEHVADAEYRGVPVRSLYGKTRKPTKEMLAPIDVLVFDLQDLGVRHYTYISTMFLAMERAAEVGIPFIVLDRPPVLGGEKVEGPMLHAEEQSFIGIARLPKRFGMTTGELARFFKGEPAYVKGKRYQPDFSRLSLTVVPMKNYDRRRYYDELPGIPQFTPPSPRIQSVEQALCYAATGIVDGTHIEEDNKGYPAFIFLRLTWLSNATDVTNFLTNAYTVYDFPGVTFTHVKEETNLVRMRVTSRGRYHASYTSLALLVAMRTFFPDVPFFDASYRYGGASGAESGFALGMGSAWFGTAFSSAKPPTFAKVREKAEEGVAAFLLKREKYLLYKTASETE